MGTSRPVKSVQGQTSKVLHTFLLRTGSLAVLGRGRDWEPLEQLSMSSAEKWPLAHRVPRTQEPTPASHPGGTRLRKAPAAVLKGASDWPHSPLHCDTQWLQPQS